MNQNSFEQPRVERVPDSTLISQIEVIQESGVIPRNKEDLASLVEPPLLEACEELYDMNINTVMSSANSKDVETGTAYIDIEFDTLSDENKGIAHGLGESFMMHGFVPMKCIKLEFPIDQNTTVGDVRRMAHETVSKLKPQEKILPTPAADPFETVEQTTEELIAEIPEIKSALVWWQQELQKEENNPDQDTAYIEHIKQTIQEYEGEIKRRESMKSE